MDAFVLSAVKDRAGLANCIDGLVKHCQPKPERIVIVYQGQVKPELPSYKGVQVIFEQENGAYPELKKEEIARQLALRWQELGLTHDEAVKQAYRACGWYYQQLLKLMLFRAFPEINDNVLVMDSDAIFINSVRVIEEDGSVPLPLGYPFLFTEGQRPSEALDSISHSHIRFAKRLLPDWRLNHGYSGMVHHMLWKRQITEEILCKAERRHGCDFSSALIKAIDSCNWNAVSEYVLYHHYALTHYREQHSTTARFVLDLLYDSASPSPLSLSQPSEMIVNSMKKHVDVNWQEVKQIGVHGFNDLINRLSSMDYLPKQEKQKLGQAVRKHGCFFISLQDTVRFWGDYGSP